MRVNKVLKKVLGLGDDVVITGWELTGAEEEDTRANLEVTVRLRVSKRGPCGRCGTKSPRFAATAAPGVWASAAVLVAALAVSGFVVWRLALEGAERAAVRAWFAARPRVEAAP